MYIPFVLALFRLSVALRAQKCPCIQRTNLLNRTSINQQNDCRNTKACQFSLIDQNYWRICTQSSCQYSSQEQKLCKNYGCVWGGTGCIDTTEQCLDNIEIDSTSFCRKICSQSEIDDEGSTNCKKDKNSCTSLTDPYICKQKMTGSKSQCWWSDQCIEQDFSKCSTITDGFFCFYKDCQFKNSICQEPACSDITKQSKCKYVRTDDENTFEVCVWKDEKCQNAEDTSHLSSDICYSNTGGTSYWDIQSNICQICSPSSETNLTVPLAVSIPLGTLILFGLIYYFRRRWLIQKQNNSYQIKTSPTLYGGIMMESKSTLCSICQTPFENKSEVKLTQCEHIFHITCFQEWNLKNKDCPLCKQVIK